MINNKLRKKIKINYALKNIDFFFNLIETEFYPRKNLFYIREIKRLSQGFNIRLNREQKLKFCNSCSCFWNVDTREIRLNPLTCCVEYKCKNCSYIRRFKYK